MKKAFVVVLALLAIAFVALAVYYWKTPAESLPHFLPGYQAGLGRAHTKHSIGAFVLGVGCAVLAWFLSGSSDSPTSPESTPTA